MSSSFSLPIRYILRAVLGLMALAFAAPALYAVTHNPALGGGRLLLLKDPVSSSPAETVEVYWPYGPKAPTEGTLTVTVDPDSVDKIDLLGGASTSTLTWSSPPYPESFQIRAKSGSLEMNDVKINIRHDSSPIGEREFTVVKVEVITSVLSTPLSGNVFANYIPGNNPEITAGLSLTNRVNFVNLIKVTPVEAVYMVAPRIVQFGSGNRTRHYRNPSPNVTQNVASVPGMTFDGEATPATGDWIMDSTRGTWATTADASDQPSEENFCINWTTIIRSNNFTTYLQYNFDDREQPIALQKAEWTFAASAVVGAFNNGAYSCVSTGATIAISDQFANTSSIAPATRNPDLNSLLSQGTDQ